MATKQTLGRRARQNARKNPGERLDAGKPLEILGSRMHKYIRVTAEDSLKRQMRDLQFPGNSDQDTFEEADDFEMPDEDEPPIFSQYEMTQMQEDAEFAEPTPPGQDIDTQQAEEQAASEAAPPTEGAAETSSD